MQKPNKRKLDEYEDKVDELEAECEDAKDELRDAKHQYKRALQVWKDAAKRRNVAEDRKKALSTITEVSRLVQLTPRSECSTCDQSLHDFQGQCSSCREWICAKCLPLCGLSDVEDPTQVDFVSSEGRDLVCGKCVMDQLQELSEEFEGGNLSAWARRVCLTALWSSGVASVLQ